METRLLVSGKKHIKREVRVREHVIKLVKYIDRVIYDVKYVVGDLQVLLEQIDLVSRQLDQSTQPRASIECKLGGRERHYRCFCSKSPAFCKHRKPLLLRDNIVSSGIQRTKRSNKFRGFIQDDNCSFSSLSSVDSFRHIDNAMEFDTVSVEFNTMWDTAFDKGLLDTNWSDQTQGSLDYLVGNTNGEHTKQVLATTSSWFSGRLEQSHTSGIEMLSFTDDSEEEYLASALPMYASKYGTIPKEIVFSVDPHHVCCKEVIPLGSGSVYCGVYEAILDACLEPYSGMVESDSFGSDIPLFWGEQNMDDVAAVNYEPTYDTQLNTWTAYTMVALDSLHTSEEELSETALDILNDNIPSSTLIDNNNSVNANKDAVHTEGDTHNVNNTTDVLETLTNRYIING